MSVENTTYGQMLERSRAREDQDFWIEEILEEASDVYSHRNGVDAGIMDAQTTSEDYEAYVLENSAVGVPIIAFEVRPLFSENYGTGFAMRPEEETEEYQEFKEAIFEAFYNNISEF